MNPITPPKFIHGAFTRPLLLPKAPLKNRPTFVLPKLEDVRMPRFRIKKLPLWEVPEDIDSSSEEEEEEDEDSCEIISDTLTESSEEY